MHSVARTVQMLWTFNCKAWTFHRLNNSAVNSNGSSACRRCSGAHALRNSDQSKEDRLIVHVVRRVVHSTPWQMHVNLNHGSNRVPHTDNSLVLSAFGRRLVWRHTNVNLKMKRTPIPTILTAILWLTINLSSLGQTTPAAFILRTSI